jgi:fatty acid desaturase
MSTELNRHDDRRPRVGTIIWGLIAMAVGLLVLAGSWWNISFNWAYVMIALLIGSGIALVVAGVLSATRNRSR